MSPPTTLAAVREQAIPRVARARLRPHSAPASYERMEGSLIRARERLAEHTVWHVNTHVVGGVTETLRAVLGLMRDAEIDARWALLDAGEGFFDLTQRLYEDLAGRPRELSAADRDLYESTLADAARDLMSLIVEDDVVVLYDPAAAGLAPALRGHGARVLWRCHVGHDDPAHRGGAAQAFLRPYLDSVTCVFSRAEFAWPAVDPSMTAVLPSSINPLSAKNQELDPASVTAILDVMGLTDDGSSAIPLFTRLDGSPWRIDRPATIVQRSPLPRSAPMVAHVASWDRLKDPIGLIDAFAHHCDPAAHLVIAGPNPDEHFETSEARAVRSEVAAAVAGLDAGVRDRIHIVGVPTDDLEENAAFVNAIQRRATVFVRKSLSEGFGLSIAESMWKAKPIVASRVGGIRELVVDGESGILIDDPSDLRAFGEAINGILADPDLAARLGAAARRRVQQRFLTDDHLTRYLGLITSV